MTFYGIQKFAPSFGFCLKKKRNTKMKNGERNELSVPEPYAFEDYYYCC